jgi:hypothetical protein
MNETPKVGNTVIFFYVHSNGLTGMSGKGVVTAVDAYSFTVDEPSLDYDRTGAAVYTYTQAEVSHLIIL